MSTSDAAVRRPSCIAAWSAAIVVSSTLKSPGPPNACTIGFIVIPAAMIPPVRKKALRVVPTEAMIVSFGHGATQLRTPNPSAGYYPRHHRS